MDNKLESSHIFLWFGKQEASDIRGQDGVEIESLLIGIYDSRPCIVPFQPMLNHFIHT